MVMWMVLIVVPLVIGVETPLFGVEFRGTALVNGTPVVDGTEISVWANNGTLKMDSVIAKEGIGYFHHLEIISKRSSNEPEHPFFPSDTNHNRVITTQ